MSNQKKLCACFGKSSAKAICKLDGVQDDRWGAGRPLLKNRLNSKCKPICQASQLVVIHPGSTAAEPFVHELVVSGRWKRLWIGIWFFPSANTKSFFCTKEKSSGNLCLSKASSQSTPHPLPNWQDFSFLTSTLAIPLNLSRSFTMSLHQKEPFLVFPGNLPKS